MSNELSLFKRIIKESSYDNTYKMAWARSLVEIASKNKSDAEIVEMKLLDIAELYIKYYWNQTIFFDLIQGSSPNRPPVVVQYVKEFIHEYYAYVNNKLPELYERVEDKILKKDLVKSYSKLLKKVKTALKFDVSYRFLILDKQSHQCIYRYTKGDDSLFMNKSFLDELKQNETDLYDLINYRWALILETFNSSPRINKKVKIMDDREIKRNPLDKFKKYLDLENKSHECFICGKSISSENLSIDHVIPWTYMYSDDIWNLVYVHRSCNSSKTNRIPSQKMIEKLKKRNENLLYELDKEDKKNKMYEELKLAIDKNYVDKFWIGSKN